MHETCLSDFPSDSFPAVHIRITLGGAGCGPGKGTRDMITRSSFSSTCRPAVADSGLYSETRFGPLQQAPQDSGTSCLSRVEATRTKELIPSSPKLEVAYDLDGDSHHWCPQRAQGGDLQRRSALSMADCVDTSWNWSCRELQRAFLGIPSWDGCRWGSYFGPT